MMHRLCSALVAFLTASLLSGCLFTSEEGSTPQDNSAMTVMDMESDGSDMSDMPAPPEDDGVLRPGYAHLT